VAQKPRELDPRASCAALFGAELRALRVRQRLSQDHVGRLVHVSGDLIGKIEKTERKPQPDLVARLDRALGAKGVLLGLAAELVDDPIPAQTVHVGELPSGTAAAPALREVLDQVRDHDHAMSSGNGLELVLGYVRSAERSGTALRGQSRAELLRTVGEGYQLAGWISFDQGDAGLAFRLLAVARSRAEQAGDVALVAFVLGPNLSFVTTYGGDPAMGVEQAYGALGWARRSGNRRLVAFTMAMAARAHARLGETALCLDLLDTAGDELGRHDGGPEDSGWLSVFDLGALEGHRGSCLLDLGLPDRAVEPLRDQDSATASRFVRNRVIWRLDRADAHLRLRDVDLACVEIDTARDLATAGVVTRRVLRRFRAVGLALRDWESVPAAADTSERLRQLIVVNG
jgi:transcriptional regulator with XRE-family HTH domain